MPLLCSVLFLLFEVCSYVSGVASLCFLLCLGFSVLFLHQVFGFLCIRFRFYFLLLFCCCAVSNFIVVSSFGAVSSVCVF